MIENFTLDTDANPENMNMLIAGINKNEEDISGLKTSVEGVSSQIGQIEINKQDKLTTPQETVITTGFSAGWSGELRYSKTKEGIVSIGIPLLQKETDMSSGDNVIYTLPIGFRPVITVSTWAYIAPMVTGDTKNGAGMVALIITPSGLLILQNVGVTISGIRRIMRTSMSFVMGG